VFLRKDVMCYCSVDFTVQATSRQIWAMVNFLVTVVGGFVFGYFVAYFADYSIPVVSAWDHLIHVPISSCVCVCEVQFEALNNNNVANK
jgi:NhaP-type Na+/H+ or K+/H+ antiporter